MMYFSKILASSIDYKMGSIVQQKSSVTRKIDFTLLPDIW